MIIAVDVDMAREIKRFYPFAAAAKVSFGA
jgi:hypothetical protein